MYRYIDPSDDSFLKNDETYQRIKEQLEPFISNLKSEEDKQLIFRMISNCYHKYHNSIKAKSQGNTELMLSTIMALLIEQSNEIERLDLLSKNNQNLIPK
ncbi:MAG: hypothetical protein L0H53_13140 [Candidatus Nitrosocosmicus sp.]|nr:hypothetical protein [Candidatus Nitrosocosmicus sp.]MDN5869086.1 hypothetical protein [Candidatus Nitrosocosmicus sp.]